MAYFHKLVPTPVGVLTLVASDHGLAGILWENESRVLARLQPSQEDPLHPILIETERQLNDYFSGTRQAFDLPLDFNGTEFQKKVWAALLTIPFGETRSYAEIARQIGHPKAVRAVGAANGQNPISLVAPGHRVIGARGKLTGLAGGLPTKAFLLHVSSALPDLVQ